MMFILFDTISDTMVLNLIVFFVVSLDKMHDLALGNNSEINSEILSMPNPEKLNVFSELQL